MFTDVLRSLRKKHGDTQESLAAKIKVPTRTYASWERSERIMPNDVLVSIADLYDVTVDYLLGREESSKNTLSVVSQVVKETSSWPSKSNSEQNLERNPNLLPDLVRKRANAHAKIDLLYNSEVQELNNFIDFLFSKRQEEEQP